MSDRARRALLRLFALLPEGARGAAVRWGGTSFQGGALCVVERRDGCLLLVRDLYRSGWGLPGGLLKRGEQPVTAVRRELREELGLEVELEERPWVVVDSRARRVDVVYSGRPVEEGAGGSLAPESPEIQEVGWFAPQALPPLQRETVVALAEVGRASGGGGGRRGGGGPRRDPPSS